MGNTAADSDWIPAVKAFQLWNVTQHQESLEYPGVPIYQTLSSALPETSQQHPKFHHTEPPKINDGKKDVRREPKEEMQEDGEEENKKLQRAIGEKYVGRKYKFTLNLTRRCVIRWQHLIVS